VANATSTKSYGLGKVELLFANSKDFFMFLAADASSTIDFSRVAIDEGVGNNPSSKEFEQTLLYSLFLLKSSRKDEEQVDL
jgi:CRISPR/Cas system-associated protein Cas7 (RAMP superfamily)